MGFGVKNENIWYHPSTPDGDIFEPLDRYFKDPLGLTDDELLPLFITFPSLKDQAYEAAHPGKMTCQVLAMAKWEWFEEWAELSPEQRADCDEYMAYKQRWQDR